LRSHTLQGPPVVRISGTLSTATPVVQMCHLVPLQIFRLYHELQYTLC